MAVPERWKQAGLELRIDECDCHWRSHLSIRNMLRAVRDSDTAELSTQQVAAATEVQRFYESRPE